MAVARNLPPALRTFLATPTPHSWIETARKRLPELLLDHANCELKAASTALGFLYRYPERAALCDRMSRLAREELRHFEQVRRLMREMSVPFRRLSASRYAGTLRQTVRVSEPGRLLDLLLTGALIEARSCERFAAMVPVLPERIGHFYAGLLASEARHFENYLSFARRECRVTDADFESRLRELQEIEASLISAPDPEFRFHSGPPAENGRTSPS